MSLEIKVMAWDMYTNVAYSKYCSDEILGQYHKLFFEALYVQ